MSVKNIVDGIQLALLSACFDGIARKMANTLHRTGRSGILTIARDFSCVILTARQELLATAESLPIHVLRGPDTMARTMTDYHKILKRGDAYLHNSPYHGCTHPADHSILVPTFVSDGNTNPAKGARGGLTGAPSPQYRRATDGSLEPLPGCAEALIGPGEMMVSISCGDGGYGSPLERAPERVAHDVAEGWIDRRRAADVYGVILDATGEVDEAATVAARARLQYGNELALACLDATISRSSWTL
jgi:N-methylhydantoinase B/oxoprolinase/acetone carboxylase alpha subunit